MIGVAGSSGVARKEGQMGVHVPVLRDETLAALAIQPEGTYLDAKSCRDWVRTAACW